MKQLLLLFLLAPACACISNAQEKEISAALDSMVATERAFAATSLQVGIRASFVKFFADSALAFSPEPYFFKEAVAKRPPPANPLARTLRWEPVMGDVSASGDMGYLMGPSTLVDNTQPNSPTHYGFYLSVWKRQQDATWKVIIDIGTTVTESIVRFFGRKFTPLGHFAKGRLAHRMDPAAGRDELLGLDRGFGKTASSKSVPSAYEGLLDDSTRAIRENVGPIAGRDSILAFVSRRPGTLLLDPMGSGVSGAGDLGYTYGSYKTVADSTTPSGYYVRVWKRNETGRWKLVVDKEAPVE